MRDEYSDLSDEELCDQLQEASDNGDMFEYSILENEVIQRFTEYVAEGRIESVNRSALIELSDDHDPDDYARVRFQPQGWSDDYAIDLDAEGPTEFFVPMSDTMDSEGNEMLDNTGKSDILHMHDNAPEWIRQWSGPFYITIERWF